MAGDGTRTARAEGRPRIKRAIFSLLKESALVEAADTVREGESEGGGNEGAAMESANGKENAEDL